MAHVRSVEPLTRWYRVVCTCAASVVNCAVDVGCKLLLAPAVLRPSSLARIRTILDRTRPGRGRDVRRGEEAALQHDQPLSNHAAAPTASPGSPEAIYIARCAEAAARRDWCAEQWSRMANLRLGLFVAVVGCLGLGWWRDASF